MQQHDIESLFERYRTGKATEDDRQVMESWYLGRAGHFDEEYSLQDRMKDADTLRSVLQKEIQSAKKLVLWPRIAVAVMILLVFGLGLLHFFSTPAPGLTSFADIAPGRNSATLVLSDGAKISLSDATVGMLANRDGAVIEKTRSGDLLYQSKAEQKAKANYHTLLTANGEQYMMQLPDGTKVWLNAGSSLKFPATFTGLKERKVLLDGEAYFEVAKNKLLPFIVHTSVQEVKVLGTHFNINSYSNEPDIKTALLEGAIRIRLLSAADGAGQERQLVPGQQALVSKSTIRIEEGITADAIAWKDGLFRFEKADIKTVMRQLARWYDLEVVYAADVPELSFSGNLHRNLLLSEAMKAFGHLGLKFKLEKRTLTVYK